MINRLGFNCPYQSYCARTPQFSYVRLLHAVPNAPAVDVYSNNSLIAKNLSYRNFTPYLPIIPGTYNIKVFPTGQKANPIIDEKIYIPPKRIWTLPVIGTLPDVELFKVDDVSMDKISGKAYVRFAHLSEKAPAVDVTLPDGTKVFDNIKYKQVTDYIPVNPGNYTLLVKVAGTDNTVLTVPNVLLKPERFYTVYAVGIPGGTPPLQALIPLDGNSYINLH